MIGPASGYVSKLSRAADDCARALAEAESERDSALAEVARLRLTVADLNEELTNARELPITRKRWGK